MSCTLFQSCSKVSLIAQASLQSSISFLDFLGVNGQNQSLSIITFAFEANNTAEKELPKLEGIPVSEDIEKKPLKVEMHPCAYSVPSDGVLDGYPKIENSTCSFCSEMCEPPDIDASIGFFDGFNNKTAFTFVGVLVGTSLIWQAYLSMVKNKKVSQEWEMIMKQ